jgi:type II secretory pathway component PulJ
VYGIDDRIEGILMMRDRHGYTLLELLLTSTLLVVVVSLCLKLHLTYDRVRLNAEGAMERNLQVQRVDAAFRDSVQQAARTLERFDGWEAGERVLILEGASQDDVVLVGETHGAGGFMLSRWFRTDDGWECGYLKEFSLQGYGFTFETSENRTVRLRLEDDGRGSEHVKVSNHLLVAGFRAEGSR